MLLVWLLVAVCGIVESPSLLLSYQDGLPSQVERGEGRGGGDDKTLLPIQVPQLCVCVGLRIRVSEKVTLGPVNLQ